jgi:cysteine-rich repeat protein
MILSQLSRRKAQAALEYILLLTVAAVVVFIGLKPAGSPSLLNRAQKATEGYYNTVTGVIMGDNPQPIDGGLCAPKPDGQRECACPAPAFGGKPCYPPAAGIAYCGDGICSAGSETGAAGHPLGPGDPLTTCFDDCDFQKDCDKCSIMTPSSACGGPCGTLTCGPQQVCMVSGCGTACPNYVQPFCQVSPTLCTASCRCAGLMNPVGVCGGGLSGKCGPYPMGPTDRCFKYAACTGTCSDYEMYIPKYDMSCDHCINGALDTDKGEVNTDCGGECKSCCGNRIIDTTVGEKCDDGNQANGDGCSSRCLIEANCVANGAIFSSCKKAFTGSQYCCGSATPGSDPTASGFPCTIPRQCDPGETITNCPDDCTPCTPNGNCISPTGTYTCNGPTTGVYENCPTIPCTIPQRCDPTEDCRSCPQDCSPGACVADVTYTCGGPTTAGHYANCPGTTCSIPRGCDAPAENCTNCSQDCPTCPACTGAVPPNSVLCPGADQGLTASTARTLVGTCSGAKCEYKCGTDYSFRFLNGGLVNTCVCTGPSCSGATSCGARTVTTSCGGSVTLPPTSDGQNATVACPVGCNGSIVGSCQNGTWQGIYGGCGSGPITCSPTSQSIVTVGATGPWPTWIDCGTTTWNQTPASTVGIAPCGPNCDGYVTKWCDATGAWDGGFGQSWWNCSLKPLPPCAATTFTPSCGPGSQPISIPALTEGQTYTQNCGPGCPSGTFSASCSGGTESIRNNCKTAACGDGTVNQTSEVCDSDTVACTAPQTGYKTCLSNCSGYGPCGPLSCAAKTVSFGTCGNVTLPTVLDGATSSATCTNGCTGTISATCSGSNFGAVTGTCAPDSCPDTRIGTLCGSVLLPGVANGSVSTIACPGSCTGGPLSATCTNGTFGALTGLCTPACPATNVTTSCGPATLNGIGAGAVSTTGCPSGCGGTVHATCGATGSFGALTDNCIGCPAKTVTTPTCGDVTLSMVGDGQTSSAACPAGCSGTVSATCSGGALGSPTIGCVKDCPALDVDTSCGFAQLPSVSNGQTSTFDCSTIGCGGTLSARCSGGTFGAPSGTCGNDCPAEVVDTKTYCNNVTLPAAATGYVSQVACRKDCVGGPISATCQSDGTFAYGATFCTEAPCAAQSVNTGNTCGTLQLPAIASSTVLGDGTIDKTKDSFVPCPAGCSGPGFSATCKLGSFGAVTGSCSPNPCASGTTATTACGSISIPGGVNSGSSSNGTCPAGCTGGVSALCTNGSFGSATGSCSPTFSWQIGAFGSCSVSCGSGTQTRPVNCINNFSGAVAPDASCTGPKPATTQPCTGTTCSPCPAYSYTDGPGGCPMNLPATPYGQPYTVSCGGECLGGSADWFCGSSGWFQQTYNGGCWAPCPAMVMSAQSGNSACAAPLPKTPNGQTYQNFSCPAGCNNGGYVTGQCFNGQWINLSNSCDF